MKSFFLLVLLPLIFGFVPEDKEIIDYTYQLVIFEGSDWCTNCRRLDNNILSDSNVIRFLDTHRIEILRVDFPQRKKLGQDLEKRNEQLAEQYNFSGVFPEIILSKKGKSLYQKLQYKNQTTKEFIAIIQKKIDKFE